MNSIPSRSSTTDQAAARARPDTKLEVVVIPVSDVGRSLEFYMRLGWRLDGDFAIGNGRLIQVTPPGSQCSVIFGTGVSPSVPGSAQFLFLVVPNIEAARQELIDKGIEASEIFHDRNGGYNFFDPAARASGPDPDRRSYASFVTFRDPDGNGWLLQEVTTRFAGRVDASETRFASTWDLASAMRRAAEAHGKHEKRIGSADANWPDWYAAYMVAEQAGTELPS